MGVPAVMTLTLRMRQGDGPAAQTVERKLERGRIVLGRGAESDWVLTDPERTISKRHCVIEQTDVGYEITDLSTNGVFLNDEDEPIGIGNTRPLRHGDRIRIGSYLIRVHVTAELNRSSPDLDPLPCFRPPPLSDLDCGLDWSVPPGAAYSPSRTISEGPEGSTDV